MESASGGGAFVACSSYLQATLPDWARDTQNRCDFPSSRFSFCLLPFLEIAGFVIVGSYIGVL